MRKIVCLLAFLATPALAADFTAPILDFDNGPASACPASEPACGKVLTLSDVSVASLMGVFPDERDLNGDEKVKRFALAMRVRNAKDITLTAEEISLLKRLIGKSYGPLVVGRAWPMIDPGEKK